MRGVSSPKKSHSIKFLSEISRNNFQAVSGEEFSECETMHELHAKREKKANKVLVKLIRKGSKPAETVQSSVAQWDGIMDTVNKKQVKAKKVSPPRPNLMMRISTEISRDAKDKRQIIPGHSYAYRHVTENRKYLKNMLQCYIASYINRALVNYAEFLLGVKTMSRQTNKLAVFSAIVALILLIPGIVNAHESIAYHSHDDAGIVVSFMGLVFSAVGFACLIRISAIRGKTYKTYRRGGSKA